MELELNILGNSDCSNVLEEDVPELSYKEWEQHR